MCGFDSCYLCLRFFYNKNKNKNKKLIFFNKKKIKLLNFYKKSFFNKNFFYINIKNKTFKLSYFFKKINNNLILLNFNKIKPSSLNFLKFKDSFFNFYLTNLNNKNFNKFFNFISFFFNSTPTIRKNLFKNNKINLYLYLFLNIPSYINKFVSTPTLHTFVKINNFYSPVLLNFFNLNRNKNFSNNDFRNNFFIFKKIKHFLFKFLKFKNNKYIRTFLISRFFFQKLYKSIDRKFNENLTIFKLLKSD
jgi:hypothetical protein